MDREDNRRYFIVGSVILEIVSPLYRQRLEKDYINRGFSSLQAFINSQSVVHLLFHLRYKNVWCCQDKLNCTNSYSLPVNYRQWDLLYTKNNRFANTHLCHCQYIAKAVKLDELDITLTGLILLNCCNLGQVETVVIKELREFKNNYLSHNTTGRIDQAEFNTLWADLKTLVLQLDHTKQDELVKIENRTFDEPLCTKYCIQLLDIHKQLDEMNKGILGNNELLQSMTLTVRRLDTALQRVDATVMEIANSNHQDSTILQDIHSSVKILLHGSSCQFNKTKGKIPVQHIKQYKLGQTIFRQHCRFDLRSVMNDEWIGAISDGVMMDDGRLVFCLLESKRLLICNTCGSKVDSIRLKPMPRYVTAVSNSTVAVTLAGSDYIEMYDINYKCKVRTIERLGNLFNITTINNKLALRVISTIYLIDYMTGDVEHTIGTDVKCHKGLYANEQRIYFGSDHDLYCYNYSGDKLYNKTLPSPPKRITSLQDASLYVTCEDRSVRHVSSDGQHQTKVKTKELKSVENCLVMGYNQKQRKLFTCSLRGSVNVFHEI